MQKDPFKKVEPIVNLLRSAVEYADAKGPCLYSSVSILCTTLTPLLNQHVQQHWLQLACCSIFHQLLSVPAYWSSIKPASYSNLVKVYAGLLQNYPVSDLASSNARIFRLLFSERTPSSVDTFSASIDILPAQTRAHAVITDIFLPLKDFLQRTSTKALQEVVIALTRFLMESGASFAQTVLGPIMKHLNHVLLSKLTKPNHHAFLPEIVNLFRVQLGLLVCPDGTFDSGLDTTHEYEPKNAPSASSDSNRDVDKQSTWSQLSESASLVGESQLYDSCIRLLGMQNNGIDTGKAVKQTDIDSDRYALFKLLSSLLVKKEIQLQSGVISSHSFKKTKGMHDPKRLIHSSIFGIESTPPFLSSTPPLSNSQVALPNSDHPRASTAPHWDIASTSVLSWIQFAFVFISDQPLFFNSSWTLNFALDLLILLERANGALQIEFWIFRLLTALASSSHMQRSHSSTYTEDDEYYDDYMLPSQRGTPHSDNTPSAKESSEHSTPPLEFRLSEPLSQLQNTWNRVWNSVLQKLGHTIDNAVGESAFTLLNVVLLHDLVPRQTVISTQPLLWHLPLLSDHHSWDLLPLFRTMTSKFPLVGVGSQNLSIPVFLLNWLEGALTKSYGESIFKLHADPALIASLLSGLISGACSPFPVARKAEASLSYSSSFRNDDIDAALDQIIGARLLDPKMNPFRTPPRPEPPPLSKPSSTSNTGNLFTISDATRETLFSKLSQLLTAKFGQTKSEYPLQLKNNAMVLDGHILTQVTRKQAYHGCILLEILKSVPNAPNSLQMEIESQLRELVALFESNLKLSEADPAVTSIILQETSTLVLCSENLPSVHVRFGSVLDLALRILHPAPPGPSSQRSGSSQSLGSLAGSRSYGDDDMEDILDDESFHSPSLTRQTTELVLSRTPSTSLSTLLFPSRLSARSQCVMHASWLVASLFKVLSPEQRNMRIAEDGIFDVIRQLFLDVYAHYPILSQLLAALSERTPHMSTDHQILLVKLISELLQTLNACHAYSDLKLVLDATVRIIRSSHSTHSCVSTSVLGASSSSVQLLPTAPSLLADCILSLKRPPWVARVALQPIITELLSLEVGEVGGTSKYDGLQTRIIQCLTDTDVRVRAAASSSICSLFGFFSEHDTIVKDLLENSFNHLLAIPTNLESLATSLSGLAQIASTSSVVLDEVLLAFHKACIAHPIFRRYVPRLLDAQVTTWGYESRLDLLSSRLSHIISRWDRLSLFPAFLYTIHDTSAFCAHYYIIILQGLLTPRTSASELIPIPMTSLTELAGFTSKSIRDMMATCYDFIYAVILLLTSTDHPAFLARARELQSLVFGESKTRQPKHLLIPTSPAYIFYLVKLLSDAHGPSMLKSRSSIQSLWSNFLHSSDHSDSSTTTSSSFSYTSVAVFRKAIEQAAQTALTPTASISDLMSSSHGGFLAQVIKSLEEWFFRCNDPVERSKAVFGVLLISSNMSLEPHSALMMFYSCFRYLHNTAHLQLRCATLWAIEAIWVSIIPSVQLRLLSTDAFIDSILSISRPLLASSSSILAEEASRVLRKVFFKNNVPIPALSSYGRFPSYLHPMFDSMNKILYATENETQKDVKTFLKAVAAIHPTATPTRVLPTLDHFCSQWTRHKHELAQLLMPSSNHDTFERNEVTYLISEVVWSLLRLSKSSDDSVQKKVAEALGMIGVFDPEVPLSVVPLTSASTTPPPTPPNARPDIITIGDEEEEEVEPNTQLLSEATPHVIGGVYKRPRDCVSSDPSQHCVALAPILFLLAEKERSTSHEISTVAKSVLHKLVSGLPFPKHEPSLLPLLCWKEWEVASLHQPPRAIATHEHAHYQISDWWANLTTEYDPWLKRLCSALCTASTHRLLRECAPMCQIDTDFAEEMLPLLLNDIFQRKDDDWLHFEAFLERASSSYSGTPNSPSVVPLHRKHFSQLVTSLVSIRSASILQTTDLLNGTITAVAGSSSAASATPTFAFVKATTSYHVAQISRMVAMPCTALAFFEFWCDTQHAGRLLWPTDTWAAPANSLAMMIYGDLGDSESVHSLRQFEGSQYDASSTASLLMKKRDWHGVLSAFETSARPNAPAVQPSLQRNMLLALQYAGYHNTMSHYVEGLASHSSEDFSEFQFQAAWRISDWNASWANVHVPIERPDSFPFHRHAFICLRTALQGEFERAQSLVDSARVQLLQTDLAFVSSENAAQIVPIMAQMQFFTDVQSAVHRMKALPPSNSSTSSSSSMRKSVVAPSRATLFQTSSKSSTSDALDAAAVEFLQQWERSLEVIRSHTSERFELAEPLVALRGLLLPFIVESSQVNELQASYWISILHAARKSRSFQLAAVALEHASSSLTSFQSQSQSPAIFPRIFPSTTSSTSGMSSSEMVSSSSSPSSVSTTEKTRASRLNALLRRFGVEKCRFYWARGLPSEAVALAKSQIKALEKGGNSADLAKMLRLTGEWLGESKLETPSVIMDKYFQRAADMLRDLRMDNAERSRAYFDWGKFADQQYRLAMDRKLTPEWQESMELQSKIQTEHGVIADDRARSTHASLYKVEMSATRREQYEERVIGLLKCAVSSYIYALLKGDQHNTQGVFRLTSLWFSNAAEPKLAELIKPNILKISAHKFLPLTYQIIARISPQTTSFQESLQALVYKIVIEHPHPCMYQLISLLNAGDASMAHRTTITLEKARVAKTILAKVSKSIPQLADGMLSLSKGYMELAMHPFPKGIGSSTQIPTRLLTQFRTPNIPVITSSSSTSSSSSPSSSSPPPYIIGFDPVCKFVGGIHKPRLIVCYGSDGRTYQQLVKGTDDLRQDAVMQQLFHTINTILISDPEAAKMKLRVRTYNVIPLSPASGVLEWVPNTQPVGEYLITGPDAAHVRYRPQDWLSSKCRTAMEAVHKATEEKKHQTFAQLLNHFKPVLHHFFNENFVDPATWYDRRVAYTRSLAAGSIVGHMVGLGDRHSQNILLDRLTGEIIHIDLGIAFDQGKALSIPELVPFRLTRDLVDALGVIGVKGVFTRCCEHTVRILRERHANLVTIAEVFLHDPLSKWLMRITGTKQHAQTSNVITNAAMDSGTANAETAALEATTSNAVQDEGPRNTKATTTLLKFKQKLLGQEEDSALSVAGQVQHLLTAAQDEKKLACMFVGWAAWL